MPVYHPQVRFSPARLWYLSTVLHHGGRHRSAKLLKAVIWMLYGAVLPPEATVSRDVQLGHLGLGVVVHPNTRIGRRVHIWHQVTLGSDATVGGPSQIIVGDDVEIGAGAKIINREGRTLELGNGCRIGANAVVVGDVPPGKTVVGVPAVPRS